MRVRFEADGGVRPSPATRSDSREERPFVYHVPNRSSAFHGSQFAKAARRGEAVGGERKDGTAGRVVPPFLKKMAGEARKPGSVPRAGCPDRGDDHSSRTAVADGLKQPTREPRTGRPRTLPYLALLRMGFTELPASPPELVSSYLTLSPLPRRSCRVATAKPGGLLSVALSLGSPPVPVRDHPALWSPDFPPARLRRRLRRAAIIWPSPTIYILLSPPSGKKPLIADSLRYRADGCSGGSSESPSV